MSYSLMIGVRKVQRQLKWHSGSLILVPFDRTFMISYFLLVFHSFIVTICLFCTISEILALISQNFKRSRDPKCTPYCRTLTCVMAVGLLFTSNLQTKFEMSSFISSEDMTCAQKCRNGSRDPDRTHLGTVSHHKANTSPGQLVCKIWSL